LESGDIGYILSSIAVTTTYNKHLPTFQKVADWPKLTGITN